VDVLEKRTSRDIGAFGDVDGARSLATGCAAMQSLRALAPCSLFLAIAACDAPPARTDPPAPSAGAQASASAPKIASAAPSASAPAVPADPFAGTWEGRFEAKKGSVTLPAKVKDKALAADDGKAAVGEGKVEITIGPRGEVRGRASGALGACTLSGKAEEGALRVRLEPEDPRADGAMSGVLLGTFEGELIKGEIQVSGPDATRVRTAAVELKRKPGG
jgi:hypothetical protein